MGYYVKLNRKSDASIDWSKKEEILAIFKKLNEPEFNELKSGGSYSGGKQTAFWYSWMPESFDEFTDAEQVIEQLGFTYEIRQTESGPRLFLKHYDNKCGQEELFLRAIAHFMTGKLIWVGEDGEIWEHTFPRPELKTEPASFTKYSNF